SFTHSSNLLLHQRTHAGARGQHKCDVCGRAFVSEAYLQKHLQCHVIEQAYIQAETEVFLASTASAEVVETVEMLFKCGSCEETFKNEELLQSHQQVHAQPEAKEERSYACTTCGKSFKNASGLSRHQHSHSSERPFKCSICEKTFVQLSNLLVHQRTHPAEQQLIQAEAEVTFPQSSEASGPPIPAEVTVPANNGLDRPYKCTVCPKAFKGSSGLRYHMRVKRSSLLSIHQRVHTGVRAFKCAECGLTFKWSSHYQYHLRPFTHSSNLQLHQRTHSSERPFRCNVCGKGFVMSSYLQRHLRTHLGQSGNNNDGGSAPQSSPAMPVLGPTLNVELANPQAAPSSQNFFLVQTSQGLQLIPSAQQNTQRFILLSPPQVVPKPAPVQNTGGLIIFSNSGQGVTMQGTPVVPKNVQKRSRAKKPVAPPPPARQNLIFVPSPAGQSATNLQIQTLPTGPRPGPNVVVLQNVGEPEVQNVHLQAVASGTGVSSAEEENVILVHNTQGGELLQAEAEQSSDGLQDMEEVQDVRIETVQTDEGVQNIIVLQNADGKQTRLCLQEVEGLQTAPELQNLQLQAAPEAPGSQKLLIIRGTQGEQTLQLMEGLPAGQSLQLVQAPPSSSTGVANLHGIPGAHGGQNMQMLQLVANPAPVMQSPQGLSTIQVVQTVPSVQLVHTF
uniref:Zinc finger protein 628 n=1 Tax=Latimeria chalumnae TaxID=7897 RepID=H3A175_LATCH